MKKLLHLLTVAVMLLATSCAEERVNISKVDYLTITSENPIIVNAEGGDVVVNYTIAEQAEVKNITPSTSEDWIESFNKSEYGKLVVKVAPNTTAEARTAVVEIVRDREVDQFEILQTGTTTSTDEVKFNALSLDGYYYGQKYGEGSDRYVLFLSKEGMNNIGQLFPNTTYYYIDAFGPVATSEAPYTLPEGTYRYDLANTGAEYTINSENSRIINTLEDGEMEYIAITNAKMVVKAHKVTLEVTVDGVKHIVSYNGGLELEDLTEDNGGDNGGGNDDPTGGQEKDAQSTLTSDYTITFPDSPRAKWIYEGDWWQTGYSNYTIMVMNKYNGYVTGDTLQLDLITDNTNKDGDFYGTYTCSYTPGKMVMMAGFTDNGARPVGCWYFEYGSGGASYKNYAMLIDGSVTITDNGNGESTIVLNSYDCHGNHITCNWTGVIEKD